MNRWGIRARVLFLALTPSALILVTLVAYFTTVRMSEVDAELRQRGTSVARQLAPGAEYALFAGDRAALQRLADAAARENDVSSVTIVDHQGEVLAHSGANGEAQSDASLRFTQPVMETRLSVADFPEQMQSSPEPRKIGEISVTMSRSAALAHRQQLLWIGLGLGMLCILLAVVLSLVIGSSVIRPIRRLAGAMHDLSEGRNAVPLALEGGEFRTLSGGFNEMASRLEANARELKSRIEAATRALLVERDAAEQATKAKSRFIAAASHDLRQPLHAIGLFTATLERRTRGAELQQVVDDLAQAVAAMERLFDSLLDISKLDAGTLTAEDRAFRLEPLFAQIEAEYLDAAKQKELRLRIRPTSLVAFTDEVLLHRLLTNLVANAIRYTDRGTVMVCARRRGSNIRLEVRDSGIGIAPDEQDDIFQEFYQVANPARDRRLGLGLGLAIVARLAQLLHTRVAVRSAPGRGSTFAVSVRASDASTLPDVVVAPEPGIGAPHDTLAVLVIDDDPLVLAGSESLLEDLGCDVTTVSDEAGAREALARLGERPVLVLCDLWLARGCNGIELLGSLTALTRASVSGILISGDTRPETIRAAKAAGYSLLHKPVSPAKLRAVVTNFAWQVRRMNAPESLDEDPAG
jgi:signal transduction histidine kinase